MNFDSYVVSGTKTALSMSLSPYAKRESSLLSPLKSAFTLAEVLITLSIIGVVAAMTVPTYTQMNI